MDFVWLPICLYRAVTIAVHLAQNSASLGGVLQRLARDPSAELPAVSIAAVFSEVLAGSLCAEQPEAPVQPATIPGKKAEPKPGVTLRHVQIELKNGEPARPTPRDVPEMRAPIGAIIPTGDGPQAQVPREVPADAPADVAMPPLAKPVAEVPQFIEKTSKPITADSVCEKPVKDSAEPRVPIPMAVPLPQVQPPLPMHLQLVNAAKPEVETGSDRKVEKKQVNRPEPEARPAGHAATQTASPHLSEVMAPRTPDIAFAARLTGMAEAQREKKPDAVAPAPVQAAEAHGKAPEKWLIAAPVVPAAPVASETNPAIAHPAVARADSEPRSVTTVPQSISKSVATALAAEPAVAPEAPRPEPLREMALHLVDDKQERVEVRFSDRSGDLRVAVHAGDAQLSQSLREGLGDLVDRLERSGFQAETWKAAGTVNAAPESDQARDSQHSAGGQSQEERHQQHRREADDQQPRPQRPQWLAEMNRRFED